MHEEENIRSIEALLQSYIQGKEKTAFKKNDHIFVDQKTYDAVYALHSKKIRCSFSYDQGACEVEYRITSTMHIVFSISDVANPAKIDLKVSTDPLGCERILEKKKG